VALGAVFLAAAGPSRGGGGTGPATAPAGDRPAGAASSRPAAPSGYVGSEDCQECHAKQQASILDSPHRLLFTDRHLPPRKQGCEGCHGPSQAHQEGDPKVVKTGVDFKTARASEVSRACLACHRDERLASFRAGSHATADMSCTSCHSIHGRGGDKSLRKAETRLCLSCHKAQRAQMNLPSHHPVREGKMSCGGCHDPHAAGKGMLKGETLNETCNRCHQEFSGPFAFEHSPVAASCATCHRPHGSVVKTLLTQQEPGLCFKCHRNPHVGFLRVGAGEGLSLVNRRLARGLEYQQCSYCHSKIHGSDEVHTFTN
jgi:DmsE family decaheme c-type cytochrome